MNTPLRDELQEIRIEIVYPKDGTWPHLSDKSTAQILDLLASKMPEKKVVYVDPDENIQSAKHAGFNQAIDQVKSILKGEKQ
jgi:hypothetical protein